MATENERNLDFQKQIFDLIVKANERQVSFQKNLGIGADEASKLSRELSKS